MSGTGGLVARLAKGEIVRMSLAAWEKAASAFIMVESFATGLAGDIRLVRRDTDWAIVEDPTPAERVIRPLRDEKSARAFIADRLAAYERMWDG